MNLRIAILHSDDATLAAGEAADALAVRAVADAVQGVMDACRLLDLEGVRVAAPPAPLALVETLSAIRADVVFNLVETLNGQAQLEAAAAWMLEMAGLPYTGAPPLALSLALEKPIAKAVLAARGVPVPAGFVLEHGDGAFGDVPPPWIVKPSREDASHGISSDSLCNEERAARRRAALVIEHYRQPALVEEFIDGREINVSILGEGDNAAALPLAEIDWSALPAHLPRIVTYEAKWLPQSPQYAGTPVVPAVLEAATEQAVRRVALDAYRALGLRDYGRVDIRLHPVRGPVVLEVNPNPDISPGAGLSRAAARGGIDHAQLIRTIIQAALDRARRAGNR